MNYGVKTAADYKGVKLPKLFILNQKMEKGLFFGLS